MQLKLDRKEVQAGIFKKRTEYELNAALLVTPEEEATIKRIGMWNKTIKPRASDDGSDSHIRELTEYTFAHLVQGRSFRGTLGTIEDYEKGIMAGCKVLKKYMEGGDAGERIIDL